MTHHGMLGNILVSVYNGLIFSGERSVDEADDSTDSFISKNSSTPSEVLLPRNEQRFRKTDKGSVRRTN